MKCALVSYWKNIPNLLLELEQYDKIFACELAAYDLLHAGVKLDRVISDFDSVPRTAFARFDVNTESLLAEKNETDTHVLLAHIVKEFPDAAVTLYNEFADRVDHALALLSLFNVKEDLVIKTPVSLLYRLTAGTYDVSVKPIYHYISFIALTKVTKLKITGLKYPLASKDIGPFADLTISNELSEGVDGTVAFTTGELLVIYAKDYAK